MDFNHGKCREMNVGRKNPPNRYNISKVTLNRSEGVRDLGVQVSSDLRLRKHCIEARNRANRLIGFIGRSIKSRSIEIILKLHLALVRPHLDLQYSFGPRIIEWVLLLLLRSILHRIFSQSIERLPKCYMGFVILVMKGD